MSLAIRDVRPQDAAGIKAFMGAVIAASVAADGQLLADLRANVDGNVDWWLAHPRDAVHLQAERDGHLAGVVLVKQFWNLCSLFVDPACQRQGIGRALLSAAMERCAASSPKQALWLNAAPGAVGFYRSLGFAERTPTKPLPAGFVAMQRRLEAP